MRNRIGFSGVLLVLVGLFTVLAAAQTRTLSGKVYGGGSPLPNTVVQALTDGTTVVVDESTTDGAGNYSLDLPDGTYDIRVIPPSGSGFGQETAQNLTIAGASRSHDFILLASAGALSGTVRGHGGAPLPNLQVTLYTSNWQLLANTTTDANGFYSVPVGSGTVIIYLQTPWPPASRPAPAYFYAYRYSVAISGNTTYDVNLPVAKVSGTVTDAGGTPVLGATVQLDSTSFGPNTTDNANNNTTTTNAAGYYELFGFLAGPHGGTSTLTVRPPAGLNASIVNDSGLTLTGDTTRNVVLPEPTFLSGTVRGHGGAPLPNLQVTLYTSNWQLLANTTTDANGFYSVPVGSGTVIVQIQTPWPPQGRPAPSYFYSYRYSVAISGNTTYDVNLPVAKVSGTVTDARETPVHGATVQLDSTSFGPNTTDNANNNTTTTNAAGYYELFGFRAGPHGGTSSLTVRPPAGLNASIVNDSGLTLTGDTTRNVVLPEPTFFSGTVRGHGGAPLPNLQVTLYTSNWQLLANTTTDANGIYSVAVGSGTVIVQIQTPWPPQGRPAPSYFYSYRYSVAISGNTTYDVNLPVAKVSGSVTDSNGAPVPGVTLQLDSTSFGPNTTDNANNNTTTTNAAGYYELFGFLAGPHGGNSTLTVRPPAGSGFSITSIANMRLTGDLTQRIILQRPDLSPPQIVAGPAVVHLSDTSVSISWTTNEAATSRVEYGIGGTGTVTADPTLTTNHTVTLLDLGPSSIYDFRVGSADAAGNGPTYSGISTFSTQAWPGDVTAPLITGGPTVVFVDQTTAIVEWTTDEPSAPTVSYGLTAALGSGVSGPAGKFTQTHSIRLTGLTADTAYFGQAGAADPDGNTTSSSVFSFKTLAVPDTAAPEITEGPTVVSVTDTKVTVSWTTNEPATSGVSYNDGTQFYVVSDSTLTRDHSITLSGLTPQTTYHITVSSTDAVGNGPTLGGPVDGTTAATPDTTAPTLSNVRVEDVTETTAVVKWTTSEPASSVVNYGVASNVPDNTKADVAAVTEHSLTLTGLLDGTRYYLTVGSTDGSGNAAVSEEINFKTISAFIDMPPTAPGPISAPAGPTRAAAVELSWSASTDDLGVTGYEVLRDGEVLASVTADTLSYSDVTAEGSFTYRIRSTDAAGHTAVSEPVTVIVDRTAPQVAVPADIIANAQGTSATIAYEASATDNVDATVSVSCAPAPGAFAVGGTTVTCSATDTAGNTGSATFLVTVRDVTAPSVTAPADQTLEATSGSGAVATFSATALDLVDGAVPAACSPASGDRFPIGTTTVWCTAKDAAANEGSASFSVTVRDTTAPAISAVTPSQRVLWPANHQMVPLFVTVDVTDIASPAPVCVITAITSNEPANAEGDGNTSGDWSFDGLKFSVRAERSGTGNGRVYTVAVRCTDDAANSSSSTTTVTVPKSQPRR